MIDVIMLSYLFAGDNVWVFLILILDKELPMLCSCLVEITDVQTV